MSNFEPRLFKATRASRHAPPGKPRGLGPRSPYCDSNDNHTEPRYVAWNGDEYVESDDDLDSLLAVLLEVAGGGGGEDFAVFTLDGLLAAIVLSGDGGAVLRIGGDDGARSIFGSWRAAR
jgi:hypothetical protein